MTRKETLPNYTTHNTFNRHITSKSRHTYQCVRHDILWHNPSHSPKLSFSSPGLCQQSYCRGAGAVFRRTSGQILWETTYPPYLQTFFFFFQNFHFSNNYDFFFVFVNMGAKISKRYFSHSFSLISTKFYDKYVSHGGI